MEIKNNSYGDQDYSENSVEESEENEELHQDEYNDYDEDKDESNQEESIDSIGFKVKKEETVFPEEEYNLYVIFVMKNSETSLYKSLLEMAKVSDNDILEVYMPEETIRKYKDNKEIIQKQPMMNYLFVRCRIGLLESNEFRRKVNKKYRVIGTISDEELNKIKLENQENMNSKLPDFAPNTRVEIVSGNYAGIIGQVNSVSGNMVNLTISILGSPTTIEVFKSDLVPIED